MELWPEYGKDTAALIDDIAGAAAPAAAPGGGAGKRRVRHDFLQASSLAFAASALPMLRCVPGPAVGGSVPAAGEAGAGVAESIPLLRPGAAHLLLPGPHPPILCVRQRTLFLAVVQAAVLLWSPLPETLLCVQAAAFAVCCFGGYLEVPQERLGYKRGWVCVRHREAPRPQAESMMPTFPSAHEQQQQELHRQKQEEMDARRRDRGIFGDSQAETLSRLARKRKLTGGLKGGGGADVTSILE